MIDVDAGMLFLDFVAERHRVWEQRQAGAPQPWTEDPVLATRKFTNVFRFLDPGSQFVIEHLLHKDPVETIMRCFLYRHTNLPEAWLAYAVEFGSMPSVYYLDDLEEFWLDYKAAGNRVFSGAYMIYPQSATPGTDKVVSILDLTRRMLSAGVFDRFVKETSQEARFAVLRMNKGVADFMSMQILTDFGYGTEFRENDFVVPGPGSRKGAAALGMRAEEAIEWGYAATREAPLLWESLAPMSARPLSRMDVQNCLCEFSKYVRYQSKPSPQKLYSPAHPGVQSTPVLPPLWRLT